MRSIFTSIVDVFDQLRLNLHVHVCKGRGGGELEERGRDEGKECK